MFRPRLLGLLLLVASLVTPEDPSLLVTGKAIAVEFEHDCDEIGDTCVKPDLIRVDQSDDKSGVKGFRCPADKLVVTSYNMLQHEPVEKIEHKKPLVKMSCLGRCDSYYRKVARGRCKKSDTACSKLDGDASAGITCKDDKRTLVVNGIVVKAAAKCDETEGWTDTHNDTAVLLKFDTTSRKVPQVYYYCHKNCDTTMIKSYCGRSRTCSKPKIKDDVIKCEGANGRPAVLVVNGASYESAACSRGAWKGKKKSGTEEILVDLFKDPLVSIKANCHTLCDKSMIENSCMSDSCKNAPQPEFATPTKLTCPADHFLKIDDVDYKEVECSEEGMKGSGKLLVDYSTYPFQKLRVKCQPYCDSSMVEEVCPGVCTATPEYKANKLTCSSESDHDLIIDSVAYTDVACTPAGWESPSNSTKLVDNTAKINKIKAYCIKKFSSVESLTGAPPPSSTPTDCTGSSEAHKDGGNERVSITALAGGLVGGIVVSLAAGIVIGMFICKKKKNRTEQASSHMSEMKKGKKNSKEENPVEADVTVMMPGHQMSQMTTGNLTAAIVASNPTPSIPSS